jgi:uncharacterized RDD family membrane protein YckC
MSEQDVAAGGDTGQVHYGGFWIRVLAYIVDSIILWVVYFVLMLLFGFDMDSMMADPEAASSMGSVLGLLNIVIWLAYSVGFISSNLQATPRKLVVGIKVTDNQGQRLGVPRALGRELSKNISALILLIGFIMVAFTDRKRGLHDMIAGTQVAYRR